MNRRLHESTEAIEQLKIETSADQRQILYSRLKASREQASFAIMMRMDPNTLTEIRKDFFLKEDEVSLHEFVYILHRHLSMQGGINENEKTEFAANMIDLFKDIDVNGDESVSWIEFTSYIVEKAGMLKENFRNHAISQYTSVTSTLHTSSQQWRRYEYSQICPLGSSQFATIEDLRKCIYVFGTRTGALTRLIKTTAVPMALEYAREGASDLLIASCSDMSIVVHNLDEYSKKRGGGNSSHSWATPDIQMSLAYMPKTNTLFSGAYRSVSSWSLDRHEEIMTIPHAHGDIVMDMIMLKNLDTLVTCSLDRSIINWDTTSQKPINKYEAHRTGVFKLTYSPSYRLIVSVGFDHDGMVWSPFVTGLVYKLKGHLHTLVGCHAVEDKPEIITADACGTFKLWDIRNFKCVQTWQTGEGKQDSKLSGFIYQSWPADDSTTEQHCRIVAASKAISAFDQLRIKKQASSDTYATQTVHWNEDKTSIITVSERNIIIWDALIGSISRANVDVSKDITASCVDDRLRKVFIGTNEGNIHCVNPTNGFIMKSASKYHIIESPVCSLAYISGNKEVLAGFSNGCICIYDDNTSEECRLLKMLERSSGHFSDNSDRLHGAAYDAHSGTVLSSYTNEPIVKVWSVSSGKTINVIQVTEDPERVCKILVLEPYPVFLTADSGGNIFIYGSPGYKKLDCRISGWINQTPSTATIEQKRHQDEDIDDEVPNRIVPATGVNRRASSQMINRMSQVVAGNSTLSADLLDYSSELYSQDDEEGFDDDKVDASVAVLAQAVSEASSAELNWGMASVNAICFDSASHLVFTGDEKGILRRFSLEDMFDDIDSKALLINEIPIFKHKCRALSRNQSSALFPVRAKAAAYLLGSRNLMCYLGVNFHWAIMAHKVRITALASTPRGVLSAADDKVVRMWSFDGYPIGILKQNVPIGAMSSSWNLKFDVNPFIKRQEDDTLSILTSVENMREAEDELTYVYHNSQLNSDVRTNIFTRSELRKRISESSRKLVLDFGSIDSLSTSNCASLTEIDSRGSLTATDSSSTCSKGTKSSSQALTELRATDDPCTSLHLLTPHEQRRKLKKMAQMNDQCIKKTKVNLPPIHFNRASHSFEDMLHESKRPVIISNMQSKIYEKNISSIEKLMEEKSSHYSSFDNLSKALQQESRKRG